MSISAADLDVFEAVRPRLFGIAYRMLGTRHEAEEIVQEAWLRWQGTDRGAVREPAAFLATATTRLAINEAQSARARRETYIGPWLPEPVDTGADPLLGAVTGEALELGVLMLLFLAGWAWAWSPRRKPEFDAAARLPLEADDGDGDAR